jgi:general secretion pathway protein C
MTRNWITPIPVLYEGYNGDDDKLNDRVKMVEEIKQLMLFREKYNNKKSNDNIINAPVYTGTVRLVGVLEHMEESKSIAILDFGGKQQTYFIHDKIEKNNSSITIVKILTDKIIINENGYYYSLILRE